MLCQSRLHNAFKNFIRHKKILIGFDFLRFFASVAIILRGVLTIQSHRKSERQNPEWMVFFLTCGSSIARKSNFFRNSLINTSRTQCARFLCVTNF